MEYRKRKHPRLKNYDYSNTGSYFITICVKDKKFLLSKITGSNNTVGRDDHGTPDDNTKTKSPTPQSVGRDDRGTPYGIAIQLTNIGQITDKYINSIENNYKNVLVDNYVIMPDHIHLLISIRNELLFDGAPRSSRPTVAIPQIIGVLKRMINKDIGQNIFQSSFNDHIIRDEIDYNTRWNYIENNPIKWFLSKNL